jgi:hypothetical protein
MPPKLPGSLAVMVVVSLFVSGCDRTTPSASTPKNTPASAGPVVPGLWEVYEQSLKSAKYVDLTHTLTPAIPVWKGFGRSKFAPTINPETGKPYTYAKDGFETTQYNLSTDQYGTGLTHRLIGRRNIPPSTSYRLPLR